MKEDQAGTAAARPKASVESSSVGLAGPDLSASRMPHGQLSCQDALPYVALCARCTFVQVGLGMVSRDGDRHRQSRAHALVKFAVCLCLYIQKLPCLFGPCLQQQVQQAIRQTDKQAGRQTVWWTMCLPSMSLCSHWLTRHGFVFLESKEHKATSQCVLVGAQFVVMCQCKHLSADLSVCPSQGCGIHLHQRGAVRHQRAAHLPGAVLRVGQQLLDCAAPR
jgi:hypothetical protein